MKKFFLFLTLTTLLLTACSKTENLKQEDKLPNVEQLSTDQTTADYATLKDVVTEQEKVQLLLPLGIQTKSEEEILAFIDGLTKEEIAVRAESYKIYKFIVATGNLEQLAADKPQFDILTLEDLNTYAPRELAAYASFEPNATGIRGCSNLIDTCIAFVRLVVKVCCGIEELGCRVEVSVTLGC